MKSNKISISELVELVSNSSGTSLAQARRVLDSFAEVTTELIMNGNSVNLPGFGKFIGVLRDNKRVRDPRTGVEIAGKPSMYIKFKTNVRTKERLKEVDG